MPAQFAGLKGSETRVCLRRVSYPEATLRAQLAFLGRFVLGAPRNFFFRGTLAAAKL